MRELSRFNYWCYKVLPLVYDDSLSYYEILCKVVAYINDIIENEKEIVDDLDALKADIAEVERRIKALETGDLYDIISKYLATMIFIEISDSGYIMYYVPESWDEITFKTTELDIHIPTYDEYGRLVLLY